MKTAPDRLYPLTLFYDAACPVCSLEMDHLRERDWRGRLRFIDIAATDFDAASHGASLQALNAELHALQPDGRFAIGVDALRLAYGAVGLGWLWQPATWPLLRPFASQAYRVFARHRIAISGRAAPLIRLIRALRARQVAPAARGRRGEPAAATLHDTLDRMHACRNGACACDSRAVAPEGRTS